VPEAPFLEPRGVDRRFGDNQVLRGIDLTVAEHQVVCLIGASGCGKSTLLRCVNALEPIQGGTISLQGVVVSGKGVDVDRHRRDVGIVFQSFNLFPTHDRAPEHHPGPAPGAEAVQPGG
jgi:polar amino acid transport system ATP-binding protein